MEVMAALTILGILAALIVPRMSAHQDKAKKSDCYANKGDIELQDRKSTRLNSSH